MSIIGNALNKQNIESADNSVNVQSTLFLKTALIIALLIILILLGVVAVILNKQSQETGLSTTDSEVHLSQESKVFLPQDLTADTTPVIQDNKVLKAPEKSIDRIVFITERLPEELEVPETVQASLGQALNTKNQRDASLNQIENEQIALQEKLEKVLSGEPEELQKIATNGSNEVLDIHLMDRDYQQKVPSIEYAFHVYSSVAAERWVRINGEDLIEGAFNSSGKLQVIEINLNDTTFRFSGQRFRLKSLVNWRGN